MMDIESSIPSSNSSVGSPAPAASDEKNAKAAIEFIEELTKNVDSVQKSVLAEILSQNANTEYLQRFNLHGATDRDTFKSNVPIITYEDIKPDIQRIADGDKSPIFSSQPVSQFIRSSGTLGGERKLFPMINEELIRRLKFRGFFMPLINLYVVLGSNEGKGLYFNLAMPDTKTPGGILARPAATSLLKNPNFYNRTYEYGRYPVYTSPIETILCTNSFQSMYSQMLCGIIMREEVLIMGVTFASGLLQVIRFLQLNWKQLAYDVKTGTINTKLVTDPLVRECMSKILYKPNPELAEFINKECESENWERIIPRIWPHTKFLHTIVTGTMAQYIPTLDYYSGGLPLVSSAYASSECFLGLNLKPFCKPSEISYTIMPNMGYFEFIHYDNDSDNSYPPISSESTPDNIVDLADLEIGKEYEIIVTTYAGLCRYRMGDILQVTSFHNAAPQFKFIKRKNVVLSIDVEKTSEEELQKGIENASALLRPYNIGVLEYTSYSDIKTIPGHYVIYWELLVKDATNKLNRETLNKCCLAIEESLNQLYRIKRRDGNTIGPLEIRVVKNGTFEKLMHDAISKGASISQYKVARCVYFMPIVEWLDSKVVSNHFSPTPPRLDPSAPPTFNGLSTSDFHAIT